MQTELPPEIREALEAELIMLESELEEAKKRGLFPARSFRSFVEQHNQSLLQYEHVGTLIRVAQRIVDDELKRVLILLPPRYFKSEVFSRLLTAFYLRQHPERLVGLASYGADLAWEMSEDARGYFMRDGGTLKEATQAKKRWASNAGGEMWASGAGGPMLGRGFHLGVVDDPIDPEKARSPVYQRRFKRWWTEKFLSRQEPNAAIVFVMQRLGVDDPVDFLFRREVGDGTDLAPQHWHVVAMDEIRSDQPFGRWKGPMGLPPTCTLERDSRRRGAVLSPSRFSLEEVKRRHLETGPDTVAAQRQQRPSAPTGDFWKLKWFQPYDQLPRDAFNRGLDWDTAFTKDEANSASAYIESYRGPGEKEKFPIYIHNVDWDWKKFPDLVSWMRSLDGPHYVEEKATGKSAVQSLEAHGVAAEEVGVKGDKLARASSVQPAVANRRIYVRRSIYETLLRAEGQGLLRVTHEQLQTSSGGLDVNDAFVQALHRHLEIHTKKRSEVLFA